MPEYAGLIRNSRPPGAAVEPGALPLDIDSIYVGRDGETEIRTNLNLAGADQPLPSLVDATDPWRRTLYVERDGVLLRNGAFIIVQAPDTETGIDITGYGPWHYFARCPIFHNRAWLGQAGAGGEGIIWGATPLGILRGLVSWWQSLGNGADIGVLVGAEVGGPPTDAFYLGYELKLMGDAVADLQKNFPFDFEITCAYEVVSGQIVPVKRLRSYLRQGRRFVEGKSPQFEYPGEIIAAPWGRDGSKYANFVFTTGQGEGDLMAKGAAYNAASIANGYPFLATVVPYKDEPSQGRLNAYANKHLREFLDPDVESTVTVTGDSFFDQGVNRGDEARFIVDSLRLPEQAVVKRIDAFTIYPPRNGELESVQLDLVPV